MAIFKILNNEKFFTKTILIKVTSFIGISMTINSEYTT